MKGKIESYLTVNDLWKKLIRKEEEKLSLVDLDIIVYEKKDLNVFFEASIIYRLQDEAQKQTFYSGVAEINHAGNVVRVYSTNSL